MLNVIDYDYVTWLVQLTLLLSYSFYNNTMILTVLLDRTVHCCLSKLPSLGRPLRLPSTVCLVARPRLTCVAFTG